MPDIRLFSIVKIESHISENKIIRGNGFSIAPDLILTPFHVVRHDSKETLSIFFPLLNRYEKVIDILDPDEELDVAILKIENSLDIPLIGLAFFPFEDMYTEPLDFQSIGYNSRNWNEDYWVNGRINNPSRTHKWDLELSAPEVSEDIEWHGYSGSPVYVKHRIFGMVIWRDDPEMGVPLGAISIEKLAPYFGRNGIEYKEYKNREMLEKDEWFLRLLDSALRVIADKKLENQSFKDSIVKRASKLIGRLKEQSACDFEMFINCIKTPFSTMFKVDDGNPENVALIAEVIIQIVLMDACKKIELNSERGRSIKLEKGYVAYLYSSQNQNYKVMLLDLFKILMEEPLDKIDEISCVLIGNTQANCTDQCATPFSGAKFDLNSIISNITDVDEMDTLTNLKPKLDFLPYHCKNCLDYWDATSLKDINNKVSEIIKG